MIWAGSRPIVGSSRMMTLGIVDQGLGDADPLLEAAGDVLDQPALDRLQAGDLDRLGHGFFALGRAGSS